MTPRTPRTALGSVLMLLAIVLFVAGWRVTAETRALLAVAERASGRVVAHEAYDREGRTPRERFRLVVSFETAQGTRVRFRSTANYGRPPYGVGDTVPVLYDPTHPFTARIDRRIETLAPLLVWGAAVLLVAGLGVGIVWKGPKGR